MMTGFSDMRRWIRVSVDSSRSMDKDELELVIMVVVVRLKTTSFYSIITGFVGFGVAESLEGFYLFIFKYFYKMELENGDSVCLHHLFSFHFLPSLHCSYPTRASPILFCHALHDYDSMCQFITQNKLTCIVIQFHLNLNMLSKILFYILCCICRSI